MVKNRIPSYMCDYINTRRNPFEYNKITTRVEKSRDIFMINYLHIRRNQFKCK